MIHLRAPVILMAAVGTWCVFCPTAAGAVSAAPTISSLPLRSTEVPSGYIQYAAGPVSAATDAQNIGEPASLIERFGWVAGYERYYGRNSTGTCCIDSYVTEWKDSRGAQQAFKLHVAVCAKACAHDPGFHQLTERGGSLSIVMFALPVQGKPQEFVKARTWKGRYYVYIQLRSLKISSYPSSMIARAVRYIDIVLSHISS